MEAPQFFRGGFCRTGNTQPAQHEVKDNKAAGEHFIIEDLLDFPNEDETTVFADNAFDSAAGNSTDSSTVTVVDSCNSSFSGCEPRIPGDVSGDLCVPYDDLAELEWLSNFVEESFSSEDLQKLQLISGVRVPKEEVSETRDLSGNDGRNSPIFRPEVSVPGKARSKRSRAAAPCNWTSRLHVLSPTTSSSESDGFAANSGKKTGKSAPKKKESAESVICDGRKCLHCATDKTPQWRTGPMGPKTLCNACGVRYKSGRLVPEYRPAASPTFVLTKHSNSHRKVLELRRQKEMHRAQPQPQFLHANPMFDAMATLAAEDDYFIQHPGSDFRHLI